MKRISNSILLVMICLTISSCNNNIKSVKELENYSKLDKLDFQTLEKKGVRISIKHQPIEFLMLQKYKHYQIEKEKLKQNSAVRNVYLELQKLKNEIKKANDNYSNSIYFILTIGYADEKKDIEYQKMSTGFNDYTTWLNTLLFSMNKYIYMDTPNIDEIPLSIYQMDRTFGITKKRSFLLVFPKYFNNVNLLKEEWLKINIKEFGLGIGIVSLKFVLPFQEINLSDNLL